MFFSTLAVLGSDGMPGSRNRTIFSKLKLHNERQAQFVASFLSSRSSVAGPRCRRSDRSKVGHGATFKNRNYLRQCVEDHGAVEIEC